MPDEQLFGTSITEITKNRVSIRTYLEKPLSQDPGSISTPQDTEYIVSWVEG